MLFTLKSFNFTVGFIAHSWFGPEILKAIVKEQHRQCSMILNYYFNTQYYNLLSLFSCCRLLLPVVCLFVYGLLPVVRIVVSKHVIRSVPLFFGPFVKPCSWLLITTQHRLSERQPWTLGNKQAEKTTKQVLGKQGLDILFMSQHMRSSNFIAVEQMYIKQKET